MHMYVNGAFKHFIIAQTSFYVCLDLSVLLNKLNEGFIALAAQLQVVHEAVKVFDWLFISISRQIA